MQHLRGPENEGLNVKMLTYNCDYGVDTRSQKNKQLEDEMDLKELLQANRDQDLYIDLPIKSNGKQWDQYYLFPRLKLIDENHARPYILQPSLFHRNHVPPTIYFDTNLTNDSMPPVGPPSYLARHFRWRITSITPNSIRNCIAFMKFETIKPSNTTDTMYVGCWYKHMLTSEFTQLDEWRKVNHYPGSFHLGRKDKLWFRLKLGQQRGIGTFHPATFVMPHDYDELKDFWSTSSSKLFIMKPPASARGNGIRVINDISQIPLDATVITPSSRKSTMVVQQYISNPCLLENGKKFDLRIYVLLTSIEPLRLYVHDKGLVRFASSTFTCQEDGIVDQFVHLTNYFINKNSREYMTSDTQNGSKWPLARFWNHIKEHYPHISTQDLWGEIIDIIIKTVISCEGPIARLARQNCRNDYTSYELFGFDIILDENFKPWILEVNITPSLRSESDVDTNVKYEVIQDMFNLVGYNLVQMPSEELPDGINDCGLFFDRRLYKEQLTKLDRFKRSKQFSGNILDDLTQNDVRVLMLTEDEFSRRGNFQRIFPSKGSNRYLKYFDKPRYYNLLLDEWENTYRDNRAEGISRLTKLSSFLNPDTCNQSSSLVIHV